MGGAASSGTDRPVQAAPLSSEPRRRSPFAPVLVGALILLAVGASLVSEAPPVSITVPYSSTPVIDAELDGDPATGTWGDALSIVIPLENGAAAPYGGATMYAKHDGTRMYLRIDGSIDVAWLSPTGNRFWLGFVVSPAGNSHHGGGTWDGIFLGLWDGTDYSPQPTYPPPAVDTNGFARPPAKDASQDVLGFLRYTGSAAPYAFTAEWRHPLNSGDADDLVYAADGATTYNFFVTTDSDGGGSGGGGISHRQVTNLNTMKIAPPGAPNTPPTVDLTTPDGAEVWTAGSTHAVRWNMTDTQDGNSVLRVWLNFSLNDGGTYAPIAGAQGITGLTCPCTFGWATPATGSTLARVRATVLDSGGMSANDASLAAFTLDATAPSVTGTVPANGATGVAPSTTVDVTFSEPMNTVATQQAFSLRRDDTGAYISGSFSWTGPTMTFTPAAALPQGISFTGRVNVTAVDRSDPGYPLSAVYSFGFTTADILPPVIQNAAANPPVQESGGSVNITASVTDNGMVAGVWVEVTDPTAVLLGNFSMSWDGGSGLYYYAAVYRTTGTYSFRVVARDAAGNWNESVGSFAVQDTTAPTIVHTPPAGATAGVPIALSASVTDNDAVGGVRLNYTDVLGATTNVTMVLSGSLYRYTIPAQPQAGTVDYFVWADDRSANEARTPGYGILVIDLDTTPPTISSVTVVPPVQDVPQPVNVTASVTDDIAVDSVFLNVTDPFGSTVGNVSMTQVGLSDTYFDEAVYPALGTYAFVIWANDTSGNPASATGQFTIVDRILPVIAGATAVPSPQEVGQPVDFSAQVADNDRVEAVTVEIRDPGAVLLGNFTMAGVGGTYTYRSSFAALGTHSFTVWARDPSSNYAFATGTFVVRDTIPPVVVATGAGTYWIGTTVVLDASNSTDNSAIADVAWNFSYNGSQVDLFGFVVQFTFDIPGRYDVNVTVTDLAGWSASDVLVVLVITDTTPPAVPRISSVLPTSPGCLEVTWGAVPDSDLAGYRLYRWNASVGAFDLIAELPASATSHEDCGLEYDRVYTYRVAAFDGYDNESPPSAMVNGRTTAPPEAGPDLLVYLPILGGAVVLVVLAVILVLRRRKPAAATVEPTGLKEGPPDE